MISNAHTVPADQSCVRPAGQVQSPASCPANIFSIDRDRLQAIPRQSFVSPLSPSSSSELETTSWVITRKHGHQRSEPCLA